MTESLIKEHELPVQTACLASGLSRSAWYSRPEPSDRDDEVKTTLNEIVERWPRWGFWKCFDRIRLDGHPWNHKRVLRVYRCMGLNLPRRKKRMLPKRESQPLIVLPAANESWALDFMHDALYWGKKFRCLNVLDEGTRECLDIEIDTSLPAGRLVRVLNRIAEWRGYPKQIRMDNGPELVSSAFAEWCQEHNVRMIHIQPGKPNQNAYIERFNRTFRHEILDTHIFDTLDQVREIAWQWMIDYNEQRPHDALNGMTPAAYREYVSAKNSTLELCA